MAFVLSDRIKETTTTTSTGTYTLGGAVSGFETFTANLSNGDTTYYCCTDGTDFEVGLGTFTSSGTKLARTTIISSSNSNNAVSWSSGSRDIFCTLPGSKVLALNGSGNILLENGAFIFDRGSSTDPTIHLTGVGPNTIRFHDGQDETDTSNAVDIAYRTSPNDLRIERSATGNIIAEFGGDDGHAALYHDNSKKLETTSGGVTITGALTGNVTGNVTGDVTGNVSGTAATVTGAAQSNITSVGTLTGLTTSGTINLSQTSGTAITTSGSLSNADLGILRAHAGADTHGFTIKYMGSRTGNNNSYSLFMDNQSGTDVEAMTVFQDGKVGINNTSPSARLDVVGDVELVGDVTGLTSLTVDDITINGSTISDSGQLTIDAGADILLDAAGNEIRLRADGTEFASLRNDSSDFLIRSAVADKDIKIQGVDGSSTINALTFDMSDAGAATFNDKITAVGTSVFTNLDISGDVDIDGTLETDALSIASTTVTATATELNYVDVTTLGTVQASKAVTADANGDVLFPDNEKLKIGTGGDLEIYHDGSNSHITDQGTGDLTLSGSSNVIFKSSPTGEYYAIFRNNGAVELYHDNSKKFETTSAGATITGALTTTEGITVTGGDSGDVLLTFSTDRSWQFQQTGDDGSTSLDLKANVDSKFFNILNSNSDTDFAFFTSHSGTPFLYIGEDAQIRFEGATANDHETILTVTDPTADRTITLPNATGTVLTTGNSDTPSTTTSSSDADFVLVDDGGTMKKITPSNLGITSGGASKGFAVAMAIAL